MTAGPGNTTDSDPNRERKNSKETIHSGHFMVSDFEAEAQDDEGVEVPDATESEGAVEEIQGGVRGINQGGVITYAKPTSNRIDGTTVSIDASLTKLFQTMSLAYRQNITSPKWNRFKGLRLRWKDKIRLNNVIWRCWHMQYIQRKNMTVCQFALDVDIHNRPEAVVLEGKYWKRRLQAVTAEYKKWRTFYKNRLTGEEPMLDQPDMLSGKSSRSTNDYKSFLGLEEMDWAGNFFFKPGTSLEGNLSECDFTDMLFSTFNTSPQLFPFPNPREIARGTGNSDLLQPGLIQLQPDLVDDDMMDIHEMLAGRPLPTVPEEDFFPEVEDAAGLPPSSSPPSNPTPTTQIEDNTRLTTPPSTYPHPNQPPTPPQLFASQERYIPTRQSPSSPQSAHIPTPTHISPSPPRIHPETEVKFGLRQENPQRPFTRSRSAQELQPHSDPRDAPPQEPPTLGLGPSFAVPKTVPKKKNYGGTISYGHQIPTCVSTTAGGAIAGPAALVFPSAVSPPSHGLADHSPPNQVPHNHQTLLPQKVVNAVELQPGTFSPNSDSALLAHLLTPESYSTPGAPLSPHHTNKIKVARIIPRPYPDVTITTGVNTTSRSNSNNSSSFSSLLNGNHSTSNCNSLAVVSTSVNHHPNLLPNVTLSAVTPSSIKSIQQNAAAQVSHWSSSGSAALSLKGSPPYPEPTSPQNAHGTAPSPPNKPFRPKNDVERVQYKEHRRVCHINAEQKRRCNIKNNFETLHSLIPAVNQNPNTKVSKATMLHKGAEYIMQMKQERQQLSDQAEQLRNNIEMLSSDISVAQSLLPATGAPVSHTRHNKIKEKFDSYVREGTLANPKYFVLALVAQPLLDTFNSSVSTASVDDLCRSSMAWLDQHCSLNVLRPVVSNAMRKLSVTTNILTTPETLYEDIFRQVTKQEENKLSSVQFPSPEQTIPR